MFYQRGFHHCSLADIAANSGIPKGNFYFYFKTKEDLLNGVIENRVSSLKQRLDEWQNDYSGPSERLIRLSEMIIRDWSDLVQFGCPTGTLALELSKQDEEPREQARFPFELILDWAETQFNSLVGQKEARKLSRQLLVRLQGASVLANVFSDESWLFEEQRSIALWIESFAG
jgi:AcrR family transcriptional regulator